MNYLRRVAIFIGVATTVAITPVVVQAQTCANSSQTPLTKSRLDQISGSLQMGQARLLNPDVYFRTGRVPTGYGGPGTPGRI